MSIKEALWNLSKGLGASAALAIVLIAVVIKILDPASATKNIKVANTGQGDPKPSVDAHPELVPLAGPAGIDAALDQGYPIQFHYRLDKPEG